MLEHPAAVALVQLLHGLLQRVGVLDVLNGVLQVVLEPPADIWAASKLCSTHATHASQPKYARHCLDVLNASFRMCWRHR